MPHGYLHTDMSGSLTGTTSSAFPIAAGTVASPYVFGDKGTGFVQRVRSAQLLIGIVLQGRKRFENRSPGRKLPGDILVRNYLPIG
jgi:hypothetical protein